MNRAAVHDVNVGSRQVTEIAEKTSEIEDCAPGIHVHEEIHVTVGAVLAGRQGPEDTYIARSRAGRRGAGSRPSSRDATYPASAWVSRFFCLPGSREVPAGASAPRVAAALAELLRHSRLLPRRGQAHFPLQGEKPRMAVQ